LSPKPHISDRLIADLADANLLTNHYSKSKAQALIRKYFCEVHENAVEQTIISVNKTTYVRPNFFDK
jgi:hypothetical protein